MKQAVQAVLALVTVFAFATATLAREAGPPRGPREDGPGWAHWQQQHKENVEFRKTLEGLDRAEVIQAIIDHREIQHKENLAFFSDQKDRRIERINSRERLTDEQKEELISFVEVAYAEKVALCTELHEEFLEMLTELADAEGAEIEQIRKALREFHEQAKGKIEAFRNEQREAWREKLEEVVGPRPARPERKTRKDG